MRRETRRFIRLQTLGIYMTVVLNDPATLADLVRFGPVPHDVDAAARQQLPFENR
jgi:hypothetical protein